MAKSAAERKEALKRRMRRSSAERDTKVKGSSALDMSVIGDKKVHNYTPKTGKETNYIDIIPFEITTSWYKDLKSFSGLVTTLEEGDVDYKLEVPLHYSVGPTNKKVLCLREAFGGPCSICDAMFAEYEKDQPSDKITSLLRPKWRTFYNVYDYDAPEKDIQMWESSYHNFEKMLMEEIELDEDEVIDISSLEEGKSIEFRCKEKIFGKNKFPEAHSFNFVDREPYPEAILDDVFNFDQMLVIPTANEVDQMFFDAPEEPPEETETHRTNARSRTAAPARSRAEATPPPARSRAAMPARTRDAVVPPPARSRAVAQQPRNMAEAVANMQSSEEEDLPFNEADAPACPHGGVFGDDCNSLEICIDCPQDIFDACASAMPGWGDAVPEEVSAPPVRERKVRPRARR